MQSIVVYVQEKNESYRINLPTKEICKLCLDLTTLHPITTLSLAKMFDNFKFIGTQLGYSMPGSVCKSCLTKLDEIGVLLKRWQGSLYTYSKMEENCAKVKLDNRQLSPNTRQTQTKHIDTNPTDTYETIKIITKLDQEEGNECETIAIVNESKESNDLVENTASHVSVQSPSDEITHSEIVVDDDTEEILHIKSDLPYFAEEILQIETELPVESEINNSESQTNLPCKDEIKLESREIQFNSDCVESETTPILSETDTNKKSKIKTAPTPKICHKCGASVMSLTQHYKKSSQCQARNYKCSMCNVYVNNSVKLLDHQRAYHWEQISATWLTCHICGQTFKYKCSLKRHLLVHEKGKQYMCEICGKGYTRATDLRDHKNIHLKIRPYVCKDCGKSFTSKTTHYTHMLTHTRMSKKGYIARRQTKPRQAVDIDIVCPICDRHFSRHDFLDKHMMSHGEDTRLRECKKCQIKFETPEEYREHTEIHKRRDHTCSYCSKSFTSAAVLEQHTFTHTGERPFLCSLCGHKFRAPAHLKRHKMLIHNINRGRPFKCKYCDKAFALKENLLPHERIHTGEKPYRCHVCNLNFIDPSRRKKHVRRCHGEGEVKNIPSSVNRHY